MSNHRKEFQDLPDATKVETPFGTMFVHHMFYDKNRSVRIDCIEGTSTVHPATVNGVEVVVTLYLTDYDDGNGFVPRQDNDNGGRSYGNSYHALHVGRSNSTMNVSDAAKKKLRETLPAIVSAWAKGKGAEFASTARATINNDIRDLQSKLEAAKSEVGMLEAEIEAKEEALAEVNHKARQATLDTFDRDRIPV